MTDKLRQAATFVRCVSTVAQDYPGKKLAVIRHDIDQARGILEDLLQDEPVIRPGRPIPVGGDSFYTEEPIPGYEHLDRILDEAFQQSAGGKGKDRHVKFDGQAFEDQPICELQRLYGRGYAYGQVGKKMEEAQRLPYEQAKAELLGGIVYLAAAIKVLEEDHDGASQQPSVGSD